jgi:hypothetical protein
VKNVLISERAIGVFLQIFQHKRNVHINDERFARLR